MNANTSTNAYALINDSVVFESSTQKQFKDFDTAFLKEFDTSFPVGSYALNLKMEPAKFEPHVQEVIDKYYAAMKNLDD